MHDKKLLGKIKKELVKEEDEPVREINHVVRKNIAEAEESKAESSFTLYVLLKTLVPKFMAKTTFEKTRDSLIKKEIIFV